MIDGDPGAGPWKLPALAAELRAFAVAAAALADVIQRVADQHQPREGKRRTKSVPTKGTK